MKPFVCPRCNGKMKVIWQDNVDLSKWRKRLRTPSKAAVAAEKKGGALARPRVRWAKVKAPRKYRIDLVCKCGMRLYYNGHNKSKTVHCLRATVRRLQHKREQGEITQ